MRFQQLNSYYESWKEDKEDDSLPYGILSSLNHILRAGGYTDSQLIYVRQVEIAIRHEFPTVLEALSKFFSSSTLLESAQALIENPAPSDDDLVSFYVDRDDAELVDRKVDEYTEEESPANWHIAGEIRSFLSQVDETILLHPKLVKSLQEIGSTEKITWVDHDFFWWIRDETWACYLPLHYRALFSACYQEGTLPDEVRRLWEAHLQSCLRCSEVDAGTRQI